MQTWIVPTSSLTIELVGIRYTSIFSTLDVTHFREVKKEEIICSFNILVFSISYENEQKMFSNLSSAVVINFFFSF